MLRAHGNKDLTVTLRENFKIIFIPPDSQAKICQRKFLEALEV